MEYDLGYFDLETKVLEPLENPFGPKVLPMWPVHSVTRVSGPDLENMVARDGVEPPTPAFSVCRYPAHSTTCRLRTAA